MKVITKNATETKKIGQALAEKLENGGVVCFFGDLGSGKTTLIQGIAKGLKVSNRITSPTFIICRKYPKNFWHVDLYRLTSLEEVKAIGLEEIMTDKKNVVLIEWPEVAKEILPKNRLDIFLRTLDNGDHEISY